MVALILRHSRGIILQIEQHGGFEFVLQNAAEAAYRVRDNGRCMGAVVND